MKVNSLDYWVKKNLSKIKESNLHRTLVEISSSMGPEVVINKKSCYQFASNNYLGLTTNPKVINSSISSASKYGVGTGGSRLVTGTSSLHRKLEEEIASFKKTQDSIVFSSGYLASIGTIPSIMSKKDIIFSDELNHACLIDGARLAGSKIVIYKHSDMVDLKKKLKKYKSNKEKKMILTDSVFSMDGDIAPLDKIVELCDEYDCISMIDEAHATGVLGDTGSGASEMFQVQDKIDICMGTLSKAVGSIGGYVAGSRDLIDFLKNKARSFIFDTSLPAPVLSASLKAISIIRKDNILREKLYDNIKYFQSYLEGSSHNYLKSTTPIVPIIVGDEIKALMYSKFLLENQIYIPAVRPPSVPVGESRIRLTFMSTHKRKHIDKLIKVMKKLEKFSN
jgi:8-amino-7-oxononanoate synthase